MNRAENLGAFGALQYTVAVVAAVPILAVSAALAWVAGALGALGQALFLLIEQDICNKADKAAWRRATRLPGAGRQGRTQVTIRGSNK